MFKALLHKQLMEIFSFITIDKRKARRRSTAAAVGFGLLFAFLLIYLGATFYFVASTLCEAFVPAGLGWLFFALMGLIAMMLGIFGSVFSTYSSMYAAKDNELLFSLPVKPGSVLLARLSGVFITGLMYELVVMIPTLIAYFIHGKPTALSVVLSLLALILLSFIVVGISCILGWLIAAIGRHVRNKTAVTVVLSLAFFAGYYYFFSQSSMILRGIIENPDGISRAMRSYVYPLYKMGEGSSGSVGSMLIFALIALGFFAAVIFVISKTYYRFSTSGQTNAARSGAGFSERSITAGSASGALFKKELRRFLSSANYIMNCGLGMLFAVAAAVALLIKGGSLVSLFTEQLGLPIELAALILCGACCIIASMNTITAPSVSLEGRNLWIAKSLPVDTRAVLDAKLKVQLALTVPPLLLLTAAVILVLRPPVAIAVLIPLVVLAFACFMAVLGLCLNLRMPNLAWTSEVVPIKQSMPAFLTLFIPWGCILVLGGLCFVTSGLLPPAAFLAVALALIAAADLLLYKWIRTKGAERFARLG